MRRTPTVLLRHALLALGIVGFAPGAAQAGLISGTWDPGFGAYLPGLSWAIQGNFFVPDACTNQADGDYFTTGICAGAAVNQAYLRLYDTGQADPNNFFQINAHSSHIDFQAPPSVGYGIRRLRITSGQVVGFEAGRQDLINVPLVLTPAFGSYFVPNAKNNLFGMIFNLAGPEIECFHCDNVNGYPTGNINGNPSVYADKSQLDQFLITYTDTGAAKQTNGNGQALGARLDGAGNFLGLGTGQVPEPGSLGLALAALVACAGLLRRR